MGAQIYTSGCPKNQNKCWYNRAFPPPEASKKQVLTLRSNNSIVMPAASTGKDKISRKVVTTNVHKNNTRLSKVSLPLPLRIVVIKLNLPTNLLTPAICNLKIDKSTEEP
jgi:hypothetical protein